VSLRPKSQTASSIAVKPYDTAHETSGSDQVPAVDWIISSQPVPYPDAVAAMEARAAAIAAGEKSEAIWLLEHPPLYTAGTSAKPADLLPDARFPVFATGRGGQFTYHGPGQRVVYVMLDVRRRSGDVRAFVSDLEGWIIDTLARFDLIGETHRDRVGVWIRRPDLGAGHEDKIAAIGIRLKRWISLHGLSINVDPDLTHFSGIVPCGIREHGVTSLSDLGLTVTMAQLDDALRATFGQRFGATVQSRSMD
jgi:lipoyl(octanoyl) transferase